MRKPYLTGSVLLLAASASPLPRRRNRRLTFEDQCERRRRLSALYSHQIGRTRSLSRRPRPVPSKRSRRYLRQSAALEMLWKFASHGGNARARLARIARNTRYLQRGAGDLRRPRKDPVLIEDCSSARLSWTTHAQPWFRTTNGFNSASRAEADCLRERLAAGERPSRRAASRLGSIRLVLEQPPRRLTRRPAVTSPPHEDSVPRPGGRSEDFLRWRQSFPTSRANQAPRR
jgi:hypothetical protein